MGRLDEVGLAQKLSRDEEERELKTEGHRLAQLRLTLGGLLGGEEGRLGPPLVTVFEGWDASGKGGAIKRLVAPLDPRHVRVKQFAAPTYDEKRHHWLLRFWDPLPGWGGMAVYDRSWYGRVLVERVEAREGDPLKSWKLTEEDWRNRDKRKQYKAAIEDMLEFTDQPGTRWY